MTLNQSLNKLRADDEAFFNAAFTHPVTGKPYSIPTNLRRVSERLCRSYGIRGSCDPMYISNVIAVELGLGDGLSHFNEKKP